MKPALVLAAINPMSTKYPVHEIFHSFQGEGIHMGRSATFVRLYGCPVHCPFCFGEGVRLHTARGRIDISKVKVGDLVWSFNEETQKQEWTTVLAVEPRQVDSYYEMTWRHKTVHSVTASVTGEHPFWVVGKGWTEAKDLNPKVQHWQGNGHHTFNAQYDVLMEIDAEAYVLAMRSKVSSNHTDSRRQAASLRMKQQNPMRSKKARNRVKWTLKRKIRTGEVANQLEKMWKRKSFRKTVVKRMTQNNPSHDPVAHAKSCFRPFGKVSQVERFVADIIQEEQLPFEHNKGKHYIGGRVPDFISTKKKKVIEVTSPDYLKRKENGYHNKNSSHYAQHGYECLTLYVNRSIRAEREVLEKITEYAHNGKDLLRKTKVKKPLTVYSLRTENHTFFVEGVLTHNCDSAGTWHPEYVPKHVTRLTAGEILKQIQPGRPEFVVITGGEPCIHKLEELTQLLLDHNIKVHLETSGAFESRASFSWITLSPKKWGPALTHMTWDAHEYKIIVEVPEDIELYWGMLQRSGYNTKSPIWLHPEWSKQEDKVVLNAITEHVKTYGSTFRAGWQLHKLYRADLLDKRSAMPAPLGGNPEKGF